MTTNNSLKYTLNDVNNIIFQGFDYTIPNETLEIISLLSMQVGSPDYAKMPLNNLESNSNSSQFLTSDTKFSSIISSSVILSLFLIFIVFIM